MPRLRSLLRAPWKKATVRGRRHLGAFFSMVVKPSFVLSIVMVQFVLSTIPFSTCHKSHDFRLCKARFRQLLRLWWKSFTAWHGLPDRADSVTTGARADGLLPTKGIGSVRPRRYICWNYMQYVISSVSGECLNIDEWLCWIALHSSSCSACELDSATNSSLRLWDPISAEALMHGLPLLPWRSGGGELSVLGTERLLGIRAS